MRFVWEQREFVRSSSTLWSLREHMRAPELEELTLLFVSISRRFYASRSQWRRSETALELSFVRVEPTREREEEEEEKPELVEVSFGGDGLGKVLEDAKVSDRSLKRRVDGGLASRRREVNFPFSAVPSISLSPSAFYHLLRTTRATQHLQQERSSRSSSCSHRHRLLVETLGRDASSPPSQRLLARRSWRRGWS